MTEGGSDSLTSNHNDKMKKRGKEWLQKEHGWGIFTHIMSPTLL